MHIKVRWITALALGCSAVPASSWAQTAASETSAGLQEVVVTATRREERLQDVPISVSAYGQEQLDVKGLRDIDDLSRVAPGVTFVRNGVGSSANYNDENADINIRGIDSQAGASTTAVYIDDTPVQSRHLGFGAVNVFPQLFDLERVEVLRGPQGTLFGASAEGGAVRFITPEPSLTRSSGYVRGELASTKSGDPSYELGAAAGAPLIDGVLGFRVSASFRRDGGWVDRVAYSLVPNPANALLPTPVFDHVVDPNANWQQTVTFRAALKWAPSEHLTVLPSFYYQRLRVNDTAAYWDVLSDPVADIYRNGNALNNPSTDPFWMVAVKLDWDLGFARLISNTAYFKRDQHSVSDYTQYLRATYAYYGYLPTIYPQPGDAGYAPFGDQQRNFYQEVRLASAAPDARVLWSAGVFYSHLNENVPETIVDPTIDAETGGNVCSVQVPCPGGLLLSVTEQRIIDKQLAAFGEVTWRVTDTFKATAGVRLSHVQYDGATYQSGPFVYSTGYLSAASGSEHPVTPKAVLAWQPDRNELLYASAAKGFRLGGTNADVGNTCGVDLATLGLPVGPDGQRHVPLQYASDSLWSYEVGSKNSLFERRLQVNASLFLVNWKNIQQNVYLPTCGEQFAANLGEVRSRGGDIDVLFTPSEDVMLQFTAAYADARFTRASCAGLLAFDPAAGVCAGIVNGNPTAAPPVVSEGDRLPGSPWSLALAAEKSFSWHSMRPYLHLDYQFTTAQTALLANQDVRNALYDTTLPGLPETKNLQLRAGVRAQGYDVSLFVQNALDQHPVLFKSRDIAYDPTDNLYFARGVRPLTVGVTATYRY
ncbi:MAG: TonB-dependent receptor [Gammaproteobacteria bacterium]|nr:TonB-dependent receptor [Gammaproteobacteria bacterium]